MNLLDIDLTKVYHYGKNDVKDYGWGCVYRNVQTIQSLNDLPVSSIASMQNEIGIDSSMSGRNLWIEPVDARRYFPWDETLTLYSSVDDPESYMLRTKKSDFDEIFKTRAETKKFLLSCLENNKRVLIDDSISSYILTGISKDNDTYFYIDPHVSNANQSLKTMSEQEFFNRNLWMMLC